MKWYTQLGIGLGILVVALLGYRFFYGLNASDYWWTSIIGVVVSFFVGVVAVTVMTMALLRWWFEVVCHER